MLEVRPVGDIDEGTLVRELSGQHCVGVAVDVQNGGVARVASDGSRSLGLDLDHRLGLFEPLDVNKQRPLLLVSQTRRRDPVIADLRNARASQF